MKFQTHLFEYVLEIKYSKIIFQYKEVVIQRSQSRAWSAFSLFYQFYFRKNNYTIHTESI